VIEAFEEAITRTPALDDGHDDSAVPVRKAGEPLRPVIGTTAKKAPGRTASCSATPGTPCRLVLTLNQRKSIAVAGNGEPSCHERRNRHQRSTPKPAHPFLLAEPPLTPLRGYSTQWHVAKHLARIPPKGSNERRVSMTMMSASLPTAASVDETLRQGILAFQQEDWPQALAHFDAAARLRPHSGEVHNHRARVYEQLGRIEEALECVDRALVIDPHNPADLRNRAVVLRKLKRPAEALASYEALLALLPNDVNALTRRALLLNELNRREEALASINRAAEVQPDSFEVLNSRVIVLDTLGRYSQALLDVDRMLGLDPGHLDAINNSGMLLARLGLFGESLRCYDRSLALCIDQPQALYNRSLVRLALGDWIRGFEEFECRWQTESLQRSRLSSEAPLWLGQEDLSGKTLLVWHEQGYGDTIQCVRYIPMLAERGARVILAVPAPLKALMQTVTGVARVVSGSEPGLQHHFHCPLMSLPRAFRTTPDTVPAPVSYLHADPAKVEQWAQRLGPWTKPRIGLVWGGRRYAPINYPRDIPLECLTPLLALDAQFIGLQKEVADTDQRRLQQLPRLQHLGESLADFADTAALTANLDLVISADTAVAHLAGALGKPIWLMNRYASCWRWMQRGVESPWYPTMKQFRQRAVGDWGSVATAVRAEAEAFVHSHTVAPRTHSGTPAVLPSQNTAPEKVRFVCATRLSEREFFAKAPLGRSLPLYRSFPKKQSIELRLFPNNSAGLSGLYNTAIEEARDEPAILVFIHDDVYLSDFYWAEYLHTALRSFNLVGLVGNRRRVPRQASWMFLDDRFTCDSYDYFSGVIGHGEAFPNLRQLSVYGPPGQEVKLLDGVLLAIHSRTLLQHELRFDPRFHFHFYDMDFCRQAELRNLKMGTCAMSVVHASAGELGNTGWRAAYADYLVKYGET
jgi:tetratricopeptide (TPR) repeat protein/GT2 family glycosyltransferase